MKINFDQVINDVYGNHLTFSEKGTKGRVTDATDKDKKDPNEVPFTLRHAAVESLLATTPADAEMEGIKKLELWELATTIHKNKAEEKKGKVTQLHSGPLELTPEELTLIRKRIGVVYGTPIVGPCWKLLDG